MSVLSQTTLADAAAAQSAALRAPSMTAEEGALFALAYAQRLIRNGDGLTVQVRLGLYRLARMQLAIAETRLWALEASTREMAAQENVR